MQYNNFPLTQIIYSVQLTSIAGKNVSKRQVDVLACILGGRPAKGIARFLSISDRTVETHTYNIMKALGCTSREGIVSFIELSDKFLILREYYISLLKEISFKNYLKRIASLTTDSKQKNLVIYSKEDENIKIFTTQLKQDLKLVGIKAIHGKRAENLSTGIVVTHNTHSKNSKHSNISITFDDQKDYYITFFKLLENFFPPHDINKLCSEFNEQHNVRHKISSLLNPIIKENLKKDLIIKWLLNYKLTTMFTLLTIVFFLSAVGIYFLKKPHHEVVARSDLSIPKDSVLLNRASLLTEIQNKLGAQAGIQNIALIGAGGAGKTTLARQYARSQNTSIVWEINADSHTSLIHSFERLAYFLSHSSEEKKFLRGLQSVENSDEKEEKIILLVREKLRAAPEWVLIFDNVHDFADIQNYFPQDLGIWGKGKIIITTRNLNIQNNSHIDDFLHVGNLNQTEKKVLFLKIFDKSGKVQQNSKELQTFLNELPSFPLDISIAAHYIKATNTPYFTYLKRLDDYQEDFDITQEKILKEEGNYTKTRFGIISLSLKEIIDSHKDFEDLLFFISLINSQCIPKNLLNKYKPDVVVDDFIYHLKKYSLFVCHPSEVKESSATFSIHRDTQKAILASLLNKMQIKKSSQIENISATMEQYLVDLIDRENFLEMKKIPNHYEKFLSHSNLFPSEAMSLITGELGHVHAHFGEYKKAKEMLQKGLRFPHQKTKIGYLAEIRLLKYLGNVERVLGNYASARKFLERSHDLCVQNLPDNFNEIGWILSHLAHVNWFEGNYTQAKDLFEKTLLIYQQHSPNNLNGTAWVLGRLGNTYRNLGDYKKAKNLLEESLALYQKCAPKNDIRMAQVLVYLGIVERKLRNYDAAKNRLEAALQIYKKHFLESHPDVGWAMVHLGHVDGHLGNYTKAKELIDRGLRTYNANLPKQHIRIARALVHLGFAERGLGNYEKGHQLMQKGLAIVKERYPTNIELPRFLAHTGLSASDVGDHSTARKLVTESLQIYKDRFSENHLEVGWALLMLASIELKSGNYETSKKLLEETLKIYRNNLEKDSLEYVRLLKYLGDVNIALGNFDLAKDYLDQSLKSYEAKNHSSRFLVLESLAELNIKKASVNKNNQDLSETLKLTAKEYLSQAIGVLNTHFPKDSPHFQRIQPKIEMLQKE